MTQVPTVKLNNGVEIPQFGFGVFQVPPDETAQTVRAAFDAGYRHIDTAQMYGNEEGVGAGLRASGLARDEVYVTSKLNNNNHRPDDVARGEHEVEPGEQHAGAVAGGKIGGLQGGAQRTPSLRSVSAARTRCDIDSLASSLMVGMNGTRGWERARPGSPLA